MCKNISVCCPTCGRELSFMINTWITCPKCGKALRLQTWEYYLAHESSIKLPLLKISELDNTEVKPEFEKIFLKNKGLSKDIPDELWKSRHIETSELISHLKFKTEEEKSWKSDPKIRDYGLEEILITLFVIIILAAFIVIIFMR